MTVQYTHLYSALKPPGAKNCFVISWKLEKERDIKIIYGFDFLPQP